MSANESNADDSMTRRTFTQSAGAGIVSGFLGLCSGDDADTVDRKDEIEAAVRERYERIANLDLYGITGISRNADTAEVEVFVRYTMEKNIDAEMATTTVEHQSGEWVVTEVGTPDAFN